jgi:hypothetical protein
MKPRANTIQTGVTAVRAAARSTVPSLRESLDRILRGLSRKEARPDPKGMPPSPFDVAPLDGDCLDPSLDPDVPCRVHQPIGS